jgi:ketosteroid isomerase-like protein
MTTSDDVPVAQAESIFHTVQETFERFIAAFSSVDWEPFHASFSEDITFFFPFLHGRWVPYRAEGRKAVEAVFEPFFKRLRDEDGDAAHISIVPKDVRIQMLNDVAIVTFHLEDERGLGRRTIVLQRQGGSWLIVHVHASIVEMDNWPPQ